jgi:hypothetical protein
MSERTCTVSNCNERPHCHGFCRPHYNRWYRTGSTDAPKKPSIEERFWAKVDASGDCWEWTAGRTTMGYGAFKYKHYSLAHRFAYELLVGPIAGNLVLDHLCRNRICVNPDHLEPVTLEENIRRGVAGKVAGAKERAKTHCPRGHEYSETNTYVVPKTGHRRCKTCHRESVARSYRIRKRAADEPPSRV